MLGKQIKHVSQSPKDFHASLEKHLGSFTKYMVDLDVTISKGAGAEVTDSVQARTGKEPRDFRQFAQDSRAVWA